jgi:uncharacterized pyridoxamine 5'-phosphate oxidase family protein
MLTKTIIELLKHKEFISIATCDLKGRPNAASKFILKIDGGFIYLVDYIFGKSYENLKANPRVSLSFVNTESLKSYQINGSVELIEQGSVYETIALELVHKEVRLSTDRIIKGVSSGKRHENFEVAIPEKFVIFKVKIEETVEMPYGGGVKREKI